jgi:hypothetical protein
MVNEEVCPLTLIATKLCDHDMKKVEQASKSAKNSDLRLGLALILKPEMATRRETTKNKAFQGIPVTF